MEFASSSTWTRLLLALIVLALSVAAFAQGGIGELTGQVTDSTGAVVSGVEVKLTNTATGEVRTTVTTPAGTYRFPALPIVGSYTLEVTSKGFKSTKVQNIIATVGQITTRDVKLEIGAASEQVTVEAGAQLVQTEDSSLSQDIDRRVWQDMPLEARNSNDFIGLLAGAEPALNSGMGTVMGGTDRGAAVNGTRSGSGNFMVEGFDNNDQGLGGGGSLGSGSGGSNTTISPDAIEEYRVIAGTPPAEYGKAGGFVTDTVLKGGTNQWHGSLFEYNRIQALAAESFFTNLARQKDHLIRNQFGGSVGGPVIKDKTFFYFTAEAHRLRTSSPLTANTFTSDFVNFVQSGQFKTFMETDPAGFCAVNEGGPCPGVFSGQSTLGPVYQKMAAQHFPLCGAGGVTCTNLTAGAQGLYTGGNAINPATIGTPACGANGCPFIPITYPVNVYGQATVSQALILNQMRYATKFDHKIGSKDQLNATYLYDNADVTEPFAGGLTGQFGPTLYDHGRAQNAGVTWSHTLSPTVLNQARIAYTRHTANFPGDPTVKGVPDTVTFYDSSAVGIGNANNLPQFFTENEFVYRDDLSVTKGKHNFKGGAEYRRTRNGSSFDLLQYGYNLPNSVEDLLTDATFDNALESRFIPPISQQGSIAESEASINPTTGKLPVYYRGYRANEVAMYIQDDWRIHPRLTLNLGVRWEYFGPPHNSQPGIDANFYQGVPVAPWVDPCAPVNGICTTTTTKGKKANPFMPTNSPYYGLFATGSAQQRNHDLWNKDLNNFGPRVGFSFDALGNQKLVVRAGFGISYDRMFNNIFENIRFNPPFFALALIGAQGNGNTISPATTAALWTVPFTGTSTFAGSNLTPSLRAMDQNLVTPYYEQAHLGVQYQIARDLVWESNYVGTFGHKLMGIIGRNNFDGLNSSGYDHTRINAAYSNNSFRTNCCDSNYHGFQTTLRKRFSAGLEFNANYTFSKALDDVSDTFTTKNAGSAAYPTDSMNTSLDYGPADFNVKHRTVGSFVYDLPFAKTNRWIGGWNVSGIVSWQTGPDFSVNNSSVDSNKDGQFNDRANYIGPGSITNAANHNQEPWRGYLNKAQWAMLNTAALPCPATVNLGKWCQGKALGQMGRNTLIGPAYFNTDLGIKKTFKITEAAALRFEANFFNIFNHPNFLYPDPNLNDANFGKSTATFNNQQSGGPRITQLAVRFDF